MLTMLNLEHTIIFQCKIYKNWDLSSLIQFEQTNNPI